MEVYQRTVNDVFSSGGEIQYFLPHFQREYAWTKENWKTLLDDLMRVYELYQEDAPPEHFMGTLVVINDGMKAGIVPSYRLVDGQQRLTTLSLLMCALGKLIKDSHPMLYRNLRKLLINADLQGDLRYKVLPTIKFRNRDAYRLVIEKESETDIPESRLDDAFRYFLQEIGLRIRMGKIDPERFYFTVRNCVRLVQIILKPDERPYEVFESLNAKGKELEAPDLVRNFIAMRLPETLQIEVFDNTWSPIEEMLRETRVVGRIGELTAFLRHYLAYRLKVLPNEGDVYKSFRDYVNQDFKSLDGFVAELQTLRRFANYFDRFLRPEHESDVKTRAALTRLKVLDDTTVYPFLLGVFDLQHNGGLKQEQLLDVLAIIENYNVRRILVGEQTNYTNKMFPSLIHSVDKTQFTNSLKSILATRNYPSDDRLRRDIPVRDLYLKKRADLLKMVFNTLNKYLSKGSDNVTTQLSFLPSI